MRRLVCRLALACFVTNGAAHAGTPCTEKPVDAREFAQGMALAARTLAVLEASDAQVVLVARVGQDLSKYGLRYSHMAYAWRDDPQGRWSVLHELNQCGTAESALFNQGLGNFFIDGMFAYEAQIVIPSGDVQRRLAAMLASTTPRRLHAPRYNMLAYPFATVYQNSNQWLLETWAAATSSFPIADRAQAQAWLKLARYQPITLDIPAMTRLGGRLFRANVAFDDQPFERRMAGHIDTVTVESVTRFVHQVDPGSHDIVIR